MNKCIDEWFSVVMIVFVMAALFRAPLSCDGEQYIAIVHSICKMRLCDENKPGMMFLLSINSDKAGAMGNIFSDNTV